MRIYPCVYISARAFGLCLNLYLCISIFPCVYIHMNIFIVTVHDMLIFTRALVFTLMGLSILSVHVDIPVTSEPASILVFSYLHFNFNSYVHVYFYTCTSCCLHIYIYMSVDIYVLLYSRCCS